MFLILVQFIYLGGCIITIWSNKINKEHTQFFIKVIYSLTGITLTVEQNDEVVFGLMTTLIMIALYRYRS